MFNKILCIVCFISILTACTTVEHETLNAEISETIMEEEFTQELIKLFNEEKFDEISDKTMKRETDLEKDFFNIALVYNYIENNKSSYWSDENFDYVIFKISEVKNPPIEIIDDINETKRSIEKKYVDFLMETPYVTLGKSKVVSIGMTQSEVLKDGWGKPIDINRTTTANGVDEQWVYDGFQYLYFEDGILVTIQN